jgi:hypothetical protein
LKVQVDWLSGDPDEHSPVEIRVDSLHVTTERLPGEMFLALVGEHLLVKVHDNRLSGAPEEPLLWKSICGVPEEPLPRESMMASSLVFLRNLYLWKSMMTSSMVLLSNL